MSSSKDTPKRSGTASGKKASGSSRPTVHQFYAAQAVAKEKARQLMKTPFLDDSPMDSTPLACSRERFRRPLLRRCPFDLSSVIFAGCVNSKPKDLQAPALLDGGLDGFNWKIRLKHGGPFFVLKVVSTFLTLFLDPFPLSCR